MRLVIPAAGMRGLGLHSVFHVLFAVLITLFTVGWCQVGARYVIPLVFSVILWAVVYWMWSGILRSIFEGQVIELGREGLRIRRRRPLFSRAVAIPYGQIRAIRLDVTEWSLDQYGAPWEPEVDASGRAGVRELVIVHDSTKTYVTEFASEAEKRWIAELLREAHRKWGAALGKARADRSRGRDS